MARRTANKRPAVRAARLKAWGWNVDDAVIPEPWQDPDTKTERWESKIAPGYNPARHYDCWSNPPGVVEDHGMYHLSPPTAAKVDPLDGREVQDPGVLIEEIDEYGKPIPGFEGRYMLTINGEVYSLPRKVKTQVILSNGQHGTRTVGGKFLKINRSRGREVVTLESPGKRSTRSLNAMHKELYPELFYGS